MGKSKDLATGASYVDTAGDTMTGALIGTSASFVGDVNIGNNDASNPANKLRFGATQYGAADIRPTDEGGHKVGMAFYTDGTGDTTIDPVLRMTIDSSGRVTTPNQPSFFVQKNNGNHTTSANIVYNNVVHNEGSHYSTSNGRFTAPVAGKYFFSATGICGNSTSTHASGDVRITVNGSTYVRGHFNMSDQWESITSQAVISLNANDYVNIYFEVGSGNSYMYGAAQYAVFSGHLLG